MEDDDALSNVNEFSVTELAGALKRVVEDAFGRVRVRGEISGYRGTHSSGHAYFSLKDDRATIQAIIWKGAFSKLKFMPEEGMEVIATGRMTTYPGRSNYQIVIDQLEPAGAGALMALLEARRKKLEAEGLFEQSRKKPIPYLPQKIGVITSPTGAVIRDIVHRISDRFPVPLLVWPVRVQGETTGEEVARAIQGFNDLLDDAPDLIIVARGGGSLEDLWGFNDEIIVRAVAASRIPIISAVGHETDWTLIDYVADLRAPTPTGAAEMAVPVKADLEAALASLKARLNAANGRQMERRRQLLAGAARALPLPDSLLALPRRRYDESDARLSRAFDASTQKRRGRFDAVRLTPRLLLRGIGEKQRATHMSGVRLAPALQQRISQKRQNFERFGQAVRPDFIARARQLLGLKAARFSPSPIARQARQAATSLAEKSQRFDRAFGGLIQNRQNRLGQIERLLANLSHKSILARGFALVRNARGQVIASKNGVESGAALQIEFADGAVDAVALGHGGKPKPASKPKASDTQSGDKQGSLL